MRDWKEIPGNVESPKKLAMKVVYYLIREGVVPEFKEINYLDTYRQLLKGVIGDLSEIIKETPLNTSSKVLMYVQRFPLASKRGLCTLFAENKERKLEYKRERYAILTGYSNEKGIYSALLRIFISPAGLEWVVSKVCDRVGRIPVILVTEKEAKYL